MPSDLTERLAAKLRADRWSWTTAGDIAFDALPPSPAPMEGRSNGK